MIIQLSYLSHATCPMDDDELLALLNKARGKNFRRGVGGLLLYRDGTFLQILEGRPDDVEGVFETIGKDPRHHSVRELLREEVAERVFLGWRMGFITPEALIQAHPSFSPALGGGQHTEPDAKFVQQLIRAFRTGELAEAVSDG